MKHIAIQEVPFHLNRAMDNGSSQDEAAEMQTHQPFYAGWPSIYSTLSMALYVFESWSG